MQRNIGWSGLGIIVLLATSLWLHGFGQASPAQHSSAARASIERGKDVYAQQCLSCHQADGGGVQNMNPPLVKTKWVLGDKDALVRIVLKGLQGAEIEIDGDVFHGVMAPHSDLSDQQIADVLSYIRNSFGNKAPVLTAKEVKAIRAKTK